MEYVHFNFYKRNLMNSPLAIISQESSSTAQTKSNYKNYEVVFLFHLDFRDCLQLLVVSEPKAKLHFDTDENHIGNIQVTLFNETVPKTVNNFLTLGNGKVFTYFKTQFHESCV